jgi:PEP-CTERM motif
MMKRKVLTAVTISLFMLFFISVGVQASVVSGATSVTQNTFGNYDSSGSYAVENAINQNGLSTKYVSGVTDWNTYFSGHPSESMVAYGNEWWGNPNSGLTGSVTFNLGGLFNIDKLALWNEDANGIASFSVYTSTDDVVFNLVASRLLPTDNPYGMDYFADIFSLTNSTGQYVKLDITAAGIGYTTVSMGEIAFSTTTTAAPEPATMLLLGLGLIGLAGVRRKIKK